MYKALMAYIHLTFVDFLLFLVLLRVGILTRDTDIANLFFRPSVCLYVRPPVCT